MKPPEPPDFGAMTKDELIEFALPLEEADIRRTGFGSAFIHALTENISQFRWMDGTFLSRLYGIQPPAQTKTTAAPELEESQIAAALDGIRRGLQEMTREQVQAHVARLCELMHLRTTLFCEFSHALGEACIGFVGANGTLAQAGTDLKKGH